MLRLEAEVPESLKAAILGLKPTCWLKRVCSRYRKCSSMHFGLGIPRNISRKQRMMFGRFSREMPELQQELVNWIRSVSDIDFCSIILNKYEPGDSMGVHSDGNLLPMQLSARFGVNAVGGELCVGEEKVGEGVFIMNANDLHWVEKLQKGTMYSIITYIKRDSFFMADFATMSQLSQWGYPMKTVGLILVYLFCTLVAGPVPLNLNFSPKSLTKSKNNMVFLASLNPSS